MSSPHPLSLLPILRSLSTTFLLLTSLTSVSSLPSPPNSDMTSTLTTSPNITSSDSRDPSNYLSRLTSCYNLARSPTLISTGRRYPTLSGMDGDYKVVEELRTYSSHCFRSAPYNHEKMLNDTLSVDDYLSTMLTESLLLSTTKSSQVSTIVASDGSLVLKRIDEELEPSRLNGRGNMLICNIHQLEHTVEQLEYLVINGKVRIEGMKQARDR